MNANEHSYSTEDKNTEEEHAGVKMRGNAALNISKIAVINARLVFNISMMKGTDHTRIDLMVEKIATRWMDRLQYKAIYLSLILFKCNGVY